MHIPASWDDRQDLVRLVVDNCMASQQERSELYQKRRRYFLYGQDMDQKVKFNRLKAHMKLVSSFLFSSEGLIYNIAAPKNADEPTVHMMLSLQDAFNEDIRDSGIADEFSDALTWALNFDTMVLKMGWNDITGQLFAQSVEPVCFGVFREDIKDFSSQPAMNHSILIDYDDACTRLIKAGKANMVPNLQIEGPQVNEVDSGLPAPVTNLIINAAGTQNITPGGNANPEFTSSPTFRARTLAPLVRFHETWVWDDDANDYRIFHSLSGPVLLSDSKDTIQAIKKSSSHETKIRFDSETNWYLPKETPFVPITPYTLYNYFWGDCHQEDIIPLQNWNNERLTQIEETLQQQIDPKRAVYGDIGLVEEKEGVDLGALWVSDNPSAKVDEMRPPMQEDLFREFNEIGSLMMEASGLTETVAGRSSGGARGGAQQKQMQVTGGGQIRKVAIGLEKSLVRMGDLALKLKMKNDDSHIKMQDGQEFIAAQIPEDFSMRVAGHSHSPLFTLETKEQAALLFKAQAIDREWLLRLTNPPELENLLSSLKIREAAEAKQHQMELTANTEKQMHKHKK